MEKKPIKRAPELVTLSADHHSMLLLAFQCKQAVGGRRLAGAGRSPEHQAQRIFEQNDAMEAHFRAEEEVVVPLYQRHVGADDPHIQRFLSDHLAIRKLVVELKGAGGAAVRELLGEFSVRVDEHVRFEERVLFGRIEAILTPQEKQTLLTQLPERARGASCSFTP